MATKHGFCTLHKIAFRRDLDPVCPQCSIARGGFFEALDFDEVSQKPLDAAGKTVDLAAVVPKAI